MKDLKCYMTSAGIKAENESIESGQVIKPVRLLFGDGVLPDSDDPRARTSLIHQVHALDCTVDVSDDNPNILEFKGSIPADVGSFTINEVGIELDNGVLYGYARGKGDYKPDVNDGATESVRYKISMLTANVDQVEITVESDSVYVDELELEARFKKHKDEDDPHEQYEKESNAATDDDIDDESIEVKHIKLPQLWRALKPSRLIEKLWLGFAAKIFPVGSAIPWFTDIAPDGFGMFKGQAFDKLTYVELAKVFPDGIIPDMRGCGVIGKEDGETVGVFEEGEVKSHGHPNSTVSQTDLGTKTTNVNGNHYHASNTPNEKALNATYGSGYASSVNTNSLGRHASTSETGNHSHTVIMGSHAHTVTIALFGALKNTINHRKVNWIVRLA